MSTPGPYPAAEGRFLPAGRTLPAGRGWAWIVQGWELFKRQPGMWIAIVVVLAVLFIVAGLIPFAGSIAMMVLLPVFTAGLMLGCRDLHTGGELELGHLFAGFRERFGTLAAIGGIYLGVSVLIALVVGLVTGGNLYTAMEGEPPRDPAAAAEVAGSLLLALLAITALMIPLAMALWFAPALVVFHGRTATQAMMESFAGCLRNLVPFLLYGIVLFAAAVVASIPFALGWLVLGPVMAASIYTAYRDIYFENGDVPHFPASQP